MKKNILSYLHYDSYDDHEEKPSQEEVSPFVQMKRDLGKFATKLELKQEHEEAGNRVVKLKQNKIVVPMPIKKELIKRETPSKYSGLDGKLQQNFLSIDDDKDDDSASLNIRL